MLANSCTARFWVTISPLPLMPLTRQPPRARAAKVRSFMVAKGRIMMVFIGIGSLLNEMQLRGGLDSEKTADYPQITQIDGDFRWRREGTVQLAMSPPFPGNANLR